jgi:hypothetical protein
MEQKLLIKPETVSKQMKHKLPTIANQTWDHSLSKTHKSDSITASNT